MSYNEHHSKALEKRNLALTSKRFAVQMKETATKQKNELNTILFGDSVNYGILSVIQMYYSLFWIGMGRKTQTPTMIDMSTAKTQYIANMEKSISIEGDGKGGLHPPDPDIPSAGLEEVDKNSVWLTNFSLEETPSGIGITQHLDNLLEQIGIEASNNTDNRGPYTSLKLAESAVLSSKGSGILGSRTENSEITTTVPYYVGIQGIDSPDSFINKPALMSVVANLRSSMETWKSQLNKIKATLEGAGNKIIVEYKIEIPGSNLETVALGIMDANTHIGKIYEYEQYFNAFAAVENSTTPATRGTFNSKLNDLKSYIEEIRSSIDTFCEDFPTVLGDASNGIKKHLTFWVTETAEKPDGAYAMYAMAESMLPEAETKIRKENEHLNFFDQNKNRWIHSPATVLAYDEIILDLDQTVKEKRLIVSWAMVNSANKYLVLKKAVSAIEGQITNAPWEIAEGTWVTDILPNGFLRNEMRIPIPEEPILFRVIAYDSDEGEIGDIPRMDSENSNSPQSNIVSGEMPFVQKENRDGVTVLEIDESLGLRDMQYILVNGELVQIRAVSESLVQLEKDCGVVTSIFQVFGLYVPVTL